MHPSCIIVVNGLITVKFYTEVEHQNITSNIFKKNRIWTDVISLRPISLAVRKDIVHKTYKIQVKSGKSLL